MNTSLGHKLSNRYQGLVAIVFGRELESNIAVIARIIDCRADILVIQLTRSWLMPARNVCNMDVANLVDSTRHVRDDISLRNLLMATARSLCRVNE